MIGLRFITLINKEFWNCLKMMNNLNHWVNRKDLWLETSYGCRKRKLINGS